MLEEVDEGLWVVGCGIVRDPVTAAVALLGGCFLFFSGSKTSFCDGEREAAGSKGNQWIASNCTLV